MISIIILSYNTQDLLVRCLSSVFSTITSESIEIIVVDNASQDGSVAQVKKKFPQVLMVENTQNVGFAAGCNIGAKKAKGDLLVFLNSDTEFSDPKTLTYMKESMETDDTGIVGGLLKNADGTYQRSFGAFYTLPSITKMLFLGEKHEMSQQNFTTVQTVDWVSGGFMMVQRTVFEKVGGFDEKIFMYVEDVEFCYRVLRLGNHIIVDPRAVVSHVGQGSSNRDFAIVKIYEGLQYFYKKHESSVEYTLLKILLGLKAIGVIIFGTIMRRPFLVKRYSEAFKTL
jgi:GT2 family glycosyltransferase